MDLYAGTRPRGRPAWTTYRSNFMLCDLVDDREEPINMRTRLRGARIYTEDPNGEPMYTWSVLDAGLDRLIERYNMVPIMTLGYMPEALTENADNRVPWGNCSTSPPKDHEKWGNFIAAIADHVLFRYGDMALEWPFEIWNEPDLPNLFWVCDPSEACCSDPYAWNQACEVEGKTTTPTGDVDRYAQLYQYAAAGIKGVDPGFSVGGPTIAGDIGRFLTPFLEGYIGEPQEEYGIPVEHFNFLSRHSYPKLVDDQLTRILQAMDVLKRREPAAFDQREDNFDYFITETGPTSAVGHTFQNTHYVAGWAVKQVDAFLGLRTHNVCENGTRKGLYCESRADCPRDNPEESGFPCIPGAPFLPEKICFWTKPVPERHGLEETHFGLAVATDDDPAKVVKRPSFNAYHALGFLSDEQVLLSGTAYGGLVHGIATRSGDHSVELILYNFDDQDSENTSTPSAVIDLTFTNLPFETFRVSQFLIDSHCSNAYDEFQAGDSILEQQRRDDLELGREPFIAQASGGSWQTRFQLGGNAVTLIVLEGTGPTFQDVPYAHPYHAQIERLYQAGYTAGCSEDPLRYCPDRSMSRAEGAVFTVRGEHGASLQPPQPTEAIFADVDLAAWYADWVTQLWEDGYTAGCGLDPLRFCPERGYTRAEGAVFGLRMRHGKDYQPPPPHGIFQDVDPQAWYADWVEAAFEAGLIEPCDAEPLLFCPQDPLTRAMAAYMVVQAKDLASGP
jgi:hypothetical protein